MGARLLKLAECLLRGRLSYFLEFFEYSFIVVNHHHRYLQILLLQGRGTVAPPPPHLMHIHPCRRCRCGCNGCSAGCCARKKSVQSELLCCQHHSLFFVAAKMDALLVPIAPACPLLMSIGSASQPCHTAALLSSHHRAGVPPYSRLRVFVSFASKVYSLSRRSASCCFGLLYCMRPPRLPARVRFADLLLPFLQVLLVLPAKDPKFKKFNESGKDQ